MLSTEEIIALESQYTSGVSNQQPIVLVRGEGARAIDVKCGENIWSYDDVLSVTEVEESRSGRRVSHLARAGGSIRAWPGSPGRNRHGSDQRADPARVSGAHP